MIRLVWACICLYILDGKIITSDQEKAEIFNEHFSTIGEKLADTLPPVEYPTSTITINRVTPTVMDINLTYESVLQGVLNLKPDKACGPDKVSPKLLKNCWSGINSIATFPLHFKCKKQ